MDEKKPIVSIIVLAYNHLDYTKMCIESLLKYTNNIDYELITINNGSKDGTEEYFKNLHNTKKISFSENIGVDKAINYGFKIADGKYTLNLSNDIIVTQNWLTNLVTCIESDNTIGMVVPVCNASSNFQQISLDYNDLDDLNLTASNFNKSNPLLWEERLKLVTYTCLFRTDLQKLIGGFDEDFNPGAFDDDAISFRIRRAGYKLILAKDTFVHHFGSITFNDEYLKSDVANINNNLFYKKFGVYSWNATMIDFNLVNLINYEKYLRKEAIDILGVGPSCASSILQIKNSFKLYKNYNVNIFYLSEYENNMIDLRTICKSCIYASYENTKQFFDYKKYDIIILEKDTNEIKNLENIFTDFVSMLENNGSIITTANEKTFNKINTCLVKNNLILDNNIDSYYTFSK